MRTNIEIDDTLMAAAMEAGGFKTKKEAVEEGLRLLRRRKVYEGLLALRGQLQWDDSDEAWARARADEDQPAAVQEPKASYAVLGQAATAGKGRSAAAGKPAVRARSTRA
jgi:Arc/MetJ family transcription regulator